jgi:hypothetical protein
MSFRFWFYAMKVGGNLAFLVAAVTFFSTSGSPFYAFHWIAVSVILALGVAGSIGGVLISMGRLRMRCPLCGALGIVGGNKQLGPSIDCETCGLVHGSGWFGLKLTQSASHPHS